MTAPLPPADIARRSPLALLIPAGTRLARFHSYGSAKHDPRYFDRSLSGRLNAPDGSYGTLYTAERKAGAFAESFLRNPGRNLIDGTTLRAKAFAELTAPADLRLVQLTGPGLAVLGATAEVTHGSDPGPNPYASAQAWSRALFLHPDRFDGIAYRARHDDAELCYALFDRAPGPLALARHETDIDAPWFWSLASRYKLGYLP